MHKDAAACVAVVEQTVEDHVDGQAAVNEQSESIGQIFSVIAGDPKPMLILNLKPGLDDQFANDLIEKVIWFNGY